MQKTIGGITPVNMTAMQKIKLREGHHSQNETIEYLIDLDKQVRKLGGIEKIQEVFNANKK